MAVAGLLFAHMNLQAAPEQEDPKKQIPWQLYVDSQEAYAMKQKLGDQVLFVDVRDPVEIMFTGFTDVVDVNIPFKLANRDKWHDKRKVFAMELNPDFERDISAYCLE